jgi:hypothetical protein
MLGRRVDVVGAGELGDNGARLCLGQRAEPPIDLVMRGVLLVGGRQRK